MCEHLNLDSVAAARGLLRAVGQLNKIGTVPTLIPTASLWTDRLGRARRVLVLVFFFGFSFRVSTGFGFPFSDGLGFGSTNLREERLGYSWSCYFA